MRKNFTYLSTAHNRDYLYQPVLCALVTRTVVGYARVSTKDQSLERQLNGIYDYAERTFDLDAGDVHIYRDKSTGTSVDRSGYQEMMNAVDAGDVDAIVVFEVSRVARSIRDLSRTADRVRDAGAALHVVSEGFVVDADDDDPYQRALFQMLGVFAELEANIRQKNVAEGIAARRANDDYHHGRPPLGFEKDDGRLLEGPEYHRVVSVLEEVARGDLSKRQAAKELDTSRRTVQRAIEERADLYGL